MRNILVRAAEVRESEQQQVFDALDDIYARLAPVDSLGAVRKRVSELPDRTEVDVLAGRLDDTMSRLETQDKALAEVARGVDGLAANMGKLFAQLDGRLDGVGARFEGVAGRMDGLEDKLQSIHRRLDELGGRLDKQDGKLEALPAAVHGPVRERVEQAEVALRERIDDGDGELRARIRELGGATEDSIGRNAEELKSAMTEAAEMVDASARLDTLAGRLERFTRRLDELTGHLTNVEDGIAARLGELEDSFKGALSNVDTTLSTRPDEESVTLLVHSSNEESERRIGGQLDEAMATVAELMLGGGAGLLPRVGMASASSSGQPLRARNGRALKGTGGSPRPADDEPAGS